MPVNNRANLSIWPCFGLFCTLLAIITLFFTFLLKYDHESNYVSSLVLTTRYSLDQMKLFASKNLDTIEYSPLLYGKWSVSFNNIVSENDYQFDFDKNDVMVFLHIQKTAGTSFERFLVNHLNISRPCLCKTDNQCNGEKKCRKCKCARPRSSNEYWLFSRYSTGWVCGLHADYTELVVSHCVDKAMDKVEGTHRLRRYYYTTFLRDPVARFISEYRHVERGATWNKSRHICNNRAPLPVELPWCYDPEIGWNNVTLDEFLSCPYNLAFNRQTRMLADLTLVHCYDMTKMPKEKRDSILLESAKNTLRTMSFYGLQNRMAESQELFERTFKLRFTKSLANWTKSKSDDTVITPLQLNAILELNHLDVELYKFAEKLFKKRLNTVRSGQNSLQ